MIAAMDIEVPCLGHQFVITDSDVKPFLSRSMKAAERFKERVEKLLIEEDGVIDHVVKRVKGEEYDINPGPKQLEQAYLINLTSRVAHLAKVLERRHENQGAAGRTYRDVRRMSFELKRRNERQKGLNVAQGRLCGFFQRAV